MQNIGRHTNIDLKIETVDTPSPGFSSIRPHEARQAIDIKMNDSIKIPLKVNELRVNKDFNSLAIDVHHRIVNILPVAFHFSY